MTHTAPRSTYVIGSAVFLRLLGGIYFCAFASLVPQIAALVGTDGLLPVTEFLERLPFERVEGWWRVPTLAWLSGGDGFLQFLCLAGALLSILIALGVLQLPSLVLCWVLYLSLKWAGQTFLSFQWDILLLEAGFLSIWMAPVAVYSRLGDGREAPRLARWLVWWLLFRLMLESGVVKLTWDDSYPASALGPSGNTWESLTALTYHYWTQPLPLWTSWFLDKLPLLFHKASVVVVLVIEIVLPFFIFAPRRLRFVAFWGFMFLMAAIAATGNYNFFNLLAVMLALTLLDDHAWPVWIRRRVEAARNGGWRRNLAVVPVAVLVLFLSIPQVLGAFGLSARPPEVLSGLRQFFLVNGYGLFRRMTETRPEIVIEGTVDGVVWEAYEFPWKPGDLARRPGFTGPHQPRLDWQMWFEALDWEANLARIGRVDPRAMSPWFRELLVRLRDGNDRVLRLLQSDPFTDRAPLRLRVSLYQYRFTTAAEKRESAHWWSRQLVWRREL